MSDALPNSLKGQFLMAMPGLPDPNFSETVTCICEHNASGALGFIINRIHPLLTIRELFTDLGMEISDRMDATPVYLGGPVQPGAVFILHGPPMTWEGCIRVTDEIGLSNTRDILEAIGRGEGPKCSMIILGCAGWAPFQLDGEMIQNSWLVCPASTRILFDIRPETRWQEAMIRMNAGLGS